MLLVLVVGMAVSAVAIAAASYSLQGLVMARRSQDKILGQTLAEAGVDAAVDTLTASYKNTSSSGTLYADAAQTIKIGTYSATISDVNVSLGQKKVISVGTTTGGTTKTVIARITQGNMQLGNAAMMSSGSIAIGGTANIQTTPANGHTANIYSNSNVGLGGSGYDDGRLLASGTVTGTAFYPSVSGAPKFPFPDTTAVTTSLAAYKTASQATSNTYNASTLFNGSHDTVTITAPAYISGDLTLQAGKTLILQGNGFIYLDGSLKLTAQAILNNKSTLVVAGSFTQQGSSNYVTDTTVTPTPTLAVGGNNGAGDVVLNGTANNDQWGIVYAMSGNIKVNGTSIFTGALVAGGGQISSTGNYTQYFPNMSSLISFPYNPIVTQVVEL